MPNRILALDLQADHLAGVAVESSFRSYEIVRHFFEPRDPEKALSEQLEEILDGMNFQPNAVLSALPGYAVSSRIFRLPFKDWRKLTQTVPFELENQVPIGLEDGIVDFQILSQDETGTTVLAAIAPNDVVEDHLTALSNAGLDPAVIDFSPIALLNVLQLFDGDRPEDFAFLHVEMHQGTLAVFEGGKLKALRSLTVTEDPPDAAFARDVAWSLRTLIAERKSSEPLPLLMSGSLPTEALAPLREQLDLAPQRLEDLPLKRVPEDLKENQGHIAPALGLALREISDSATLGLDFRKGPFTYQAAQAEVRSTLIGVAFVAAMTFALFIASQVVQRSYLTAEYEELDGLVTTVFRDALGEDVPAVNEIAQMEEAIGSLRGGGGDRLPGQGVPPLQVLLELATKAPKPRQMDVSQLTMDGDTVRLKATTASFESVDAIKTSLAASAIFCDLEVKNPRLTSKSEVEFGLDLNVACEPEEAE